MPQTSGSIDQLANRSGAILAQRCNGNGAINTQRCNRPRQGLAVAIKSTSTPSTSAASVRLNADGSAILLTSTSDMGQGAQTALAQIVADELALPFERVTVTFPDSDITPYDKSTSSSRATFHMGKAAQIAVGQIREQLFHAAAKALEARVEDLELRDQPLASKGRAGKEPDLSAALQGDLRRGQRQLVRQPHAAHTRRCRCHDRSRQRFVVLVLLCRRRRGRSRHRNRQSARLASR